MGPRSLETAALLFARTGNIRVESRFCEAGFWFDDLRERMR